MEKKDDLKDIFDAANNLELLKNEMNKRFPNKVILRELVPLQSFQFKGINADLVQSLHDFAAANNKIYSTSTRRELLGVPAVIYEGDSSFYWLESKKHDANYQPFYATWMTSAALLVQFAAGLGYRQIVDIGSGDGRISYTAKVHGLESYGIELDPSLIELQHQIMNKTKIFYELFNDDATTFDYSKLHLTMPIFFISGLPEMGEMLAEAVIRSVIRQPRTNGNFGFCFMGSHSLRDFSRDHTGWGWGKTISRHGLTWLHTLSLPTQWTTDQPLNTPYVYASG